MLDIVGKRYWYFLISGLIILPGLISLILFGLKPGIDFSSGTVITIRFSQPLDQGQLRGEMATLHRGEAVIQRSGDSTFLIRTKTLREEEKDATGNVTKPSERQEIVAGLTARFGPAEVLSYDSVSPIIAAEIVRNATLAVIVASVGILLYITWAFRRVAKPFRYGTCAIIALVHDVLVVLGVSSILGQLFNLEIDSMFITALLTVIGFSVHDTIVVFDRIRENLRKALPGGFEMVVNHSLLQTLGRSLTTSLTVVFTLTALLLFGGSTIYNFVLVLLIGIISGTYSSIFNASQILVVWENGEIGRLWRRLPSPAFGGPARK